VAFKLLLILIPISLVAKFFFPEWQIAIFITSAAAIVPLAEWIRRATEQLARAAGPAIGGLLNVSFGNLAELILALFVLMDGKADVVKGQITGSIIGNALLGLGLCILVGTWGRERQKFHRDRAGLLASLLVLAVIALLVPALFDYTERLTAKADASALDERLSLCVSVVLVAVYLANLVYTLWTHRDVFALEHEGKQAEWPVWQAVLVLLVASALTGVEAEMISGALAATAKRFGLTEFFLGVTVLAILGNAAEYLSAAYFARKNQLGLAMSITVGSTIQVALLLAPLLVLGSYVLGQPMNLVFSNPLELIAIAAVAFIVSAISQDGEATWFEGLLLVAVYVILALAFFFVTP
jgi:Ca2+:H+ antiporter